MAVRNCLLSLVIAIGLWTSVEGQNSGPGIPRAMRECYGNITLYDRTLRIPSSITAFTALIDRVERIPSLNMDMRTLTATLVHGFRADGVERDPEVQSSPGVIPFTTSGFQNGRYRLLVEKLLPGNAVNFPNASLTGEQRCALHFMLSSTVDIWERGDEGSVCSRLQNFRSYRAPRDADVTVDDLEEESEGDVEVLEEDHDDGLAARQYQQREESQCPLEEGVIWTPWGAVNTGALLAGIATGLQRQDVSLQQMALSPLAGGRALTDTGPVSNLYAASFSGDLGEVVLLQGPKSAGQVTIGGSGGWNDTAMPKHYFLSKNENFELSDAEIRGCLDGLILGLAMPDLQNALGGSKLSLAQVLEMYYSERGFPTQRKIRACQRRDHVARVIPNDELIKQTRNIIPALQRYLAGVTVEDTTMDSYINNAVSRLLSYIPSLNDKNCLIVQNETPTPNDQLATPAVDLTLVIDPNWMYDDALPTVAALLRDVSPHPSGSALSLFVGSASETPLINYTRSILDFYGNFTEDNYRLFGNSQLEVTRSMAQLRGVFAARRDEEKRLNRAGGRSQAVLFIAHTAMGATDEQSKLFMQNEFRIFREANPDVRVLFLCSGNKDRFRDLVLDPERDLFLMQAPSGYNGIPDVSDVVKRLSELPARFTNPECGAKWDANSNNKGGGQQMQFYADPLGISYYRLLPNYFFHSERNYVRFQGTGQGRLIICFSRTNEQPKSTGDPGQSGTDTDGNTCRQIANSESTEFRIDWPCDGARSALSCKPMYFSVVAAETMNRCNSLVGQNAEEGCRFPDLVRYTVTASGLGCHSGASLMSAALSASLLLLVAVLRVVAIN